MGKALKGRWELGMRVLTRVQGKDFEVRLSMSYDTNTKDFTFKGESNSTFYNFLNVKGLSASPKLSATQQKRALP
jgi:hypothetical protein